MSPVLTTAGSTEIVIRLAHALALGTNVIQDLDRLGSEFWCPGVVAIDPADKRRGIIGSDAHAMCLRIRRMDMPQVLFKANDPGGDRLGAIRMNDHSRTDGIIGHTTILHV
jgi:hypothetical protein